MFTKEFGDYACDGATIECEKDGFEIVARIEMDSDYHIDNDDCHNVDQSVTGCTDEQFKRMMKARTAWLNDEWFCCGVVLSVSRKGIELDSYAASLWGIECSYPGSTNEYLTEVANELLDEAIAVGKQRIEELCINEMRGER